MPSHCTPGVYIEEFPAFPPAVAPVATAIPAFIGYTQTALDSQGQDLTRKAVRITSVREYEACFGTSPVQDMKFEVTKYVGPASELLRVEVRWDDKPTVPTHLLHYAIQLYFANGGGPCYVYSVGNQEATPATTDFTDAITALEAEVEPTLLAFPDAVKLVPDGEYGAVVDAALKSCNKTRNLFTLIDVPNAVPGKTDDNDKVSANFRAHVTWNTVEFLKHGAAYFPYLDTDIPFASAEQHVTVAVTVAGEGPAESNASHKKLSELHHDTAVHAAIQALVREACVTLPPAAAIAGVYAQVDRTRGVWKSPANVSLSRVSGPAVNVTRELQDELGIDNTTGLSVNVIRTFSGKGARVWGGRTLAGNDREWRHISVRRFTNFVEASVRKALGAFVFEPNVASTWVRAQAMIENFLTELWHNGALMGTRPEQAFGVEIGLGKTMSAEDVLDGRMIVVVHLALLRPAEFMVLSVMQKMAEA